MKGRKWKIAVEERGRADVCLKMLITRLGNTEKEICSGVSQAIFKYFSVQCSQSKILQCLILIF